MQCIRLFVLLVAFAPLIINAQERPTVELLLGDVSMNKLPFVLALDAGVCTGMGIELMEHRAKSIHAERDRGAPFGDTSWN